MKRTMFFLCLITVMLLAACNPAPEPGATKEDANPGIEGVWTHVETEQIGGPDAGKVTSPQPSLVFITKKYYCSNFVSTTEPRPAFKTQTPTNEQIVKAYKGFIAVAGPYELKGSTLVIHPAVSIDPDMMYGGSLELAYQLNGDTLTLIVDPAKITYTTMSDYKPNYQEGRYILKRLE